MAPQLFLVRHGESKANVRGLVVSTMNEGVKEEHGLTERGQEQAKAAGQQLRTKADQAGIDVTSILFLTSPFSRAKGTADLMKSSLCPEAPMEVDKRLIERSFGEENELRDASSIYHEVAQGDLASLSHHPSGIMESVLSVVQRMTDAVAEAMDRWPDCQAICVVSHGDPLQILNAAIQANPSDPLPALSNFRQRKIENAELLGPLTVDDSWSASSFRQLACSQSS